MANYKSLTLKFSADSGDLEKALESIAKKSAETQKSLEYIGGGAGFGYSLAQGGAALKTFGDGLARIGDKLSIVSAAWIMTFGRKIVSDVEEFGNAMAQVGGYLDIAGAKLDTMRELALYFGKETQYSATEAAQAMGELAKGGLTDAEIAAGALDSTMQLAAAGQMGFADAAKVSVQAIKAFGLEASDSMKVADALAGAANSSVAEVSGLATGFSYAAGWARQAGWSINEVAGALALLSDYGIDAEMGGTALRNVLTRLAAPTDKAAKLMAEYGIEVRDANGNMKSATEVIDVLNMALAGLADNERDQIVNTLFGTRGANAAIALMDAGAESLQTYIGYTSELGAASKLAKAQMGDLGWALEYLRGEAETAAVNFGTSLEPMLIEAAQAAEELLKWFNSLTDSERDFYVQMMLIAVGTGPLLSIAGRAISVLGSVTGGIGSAVLGLSAFVKTAKTTGSAMTALSAAFQAGGFMSTAKAASAANVALMGLKGGLIGLAVVLAALAIGTVVKHFADLHAEAERVQKRLDLAADASNALSSSLNSSAPSAENAANAYQVLSESIDTSAEAVDNLLQSHIDLAQTIADRNASAQDTINILTTAKGFIDEFAGAESLAADEVAKLQWALDVVNQETGRNYELMYANSGVIAENGEAVDNLTESLNDLIDARIREAQASAISANMTDLYKEQYELERQKTAIEKDIADAMKELHELQLMDDGWDPYIRNQDIINAHNENKNRQEELRAEIEELKRSIDGLDGTMQDNADTIDFYTQKYAETIPPIETMEDKLRALMSAAGEDVFGRLGERSEEFVNRLEAAGVSAESFSTLTQSQFSALVTALWADGYKMEDMLALVTGNINLASEDWQKAIQEWADQNGITTEEAMEAIRKGIENGETDVTNGLESVFRSSIGAAKDYARRNAPGAGAEVVSGVRGEVMGADSTTWGEHLVSNIAQGMRNREYLVTSAAKSIAARITDYLGQSVSRLGPLHYTDVWGKHLMQNIVDGMESEMHNLERTSLRVADTLSWGINDRSLYMSAGNGQGGGVNIYIDGLRVNDDPAMRQACIDFAYELEAKRRGYGG